ncbi:hypothetical protein LshimejAT787_1600380 [Lyophyllum shimeji]|uniref:Uncharacterized protein n=1 Tax=Lyophyllum shimeji TaxID=47721 RepID=A0A9P3USZ3_LYOSH|nr:hypothetical protein LshimejAT787_1600380 [Lyophyllum shimeji]
MYKMPDYHFADLFGGGQAVRPRAAPKVGPTLDYLDEAVGESNRPDIYEAKKGGPPWTGPDQCERICAGEETQADQTQAAVQSNPVMS